MELGRVENGDMNGLRPLGDSATGSGEPDRTGVADAL